MAEAEAAVKRGLSLRAVLLILALIPSVAVVVLWAMDSARLYGNWHEVKQRNEAGKHVALPVITVFYDLQAERQLSAATLADPSAYRTQLARQRQITDASLKSLESVSGSNPADIAKGFERVSQDLKQLPGYRNAVDRRTATQEQTYDAYTGIIASDLQLFSTFADVGIAELTVLSRPALATQWGLEMLSREDAVFTAGAVSGHFTASQRSRIAELVGSQQHIYDDEVIPLLPDAQAELYRGVMSGAAWRLKVQVEQTVLSAPASADGRTDVSARLGKEWRQAIGKITPQLNQAANTYSGYLIKTTDDRLGGLMKDLITNSAVGGGAVLLVMLISLRLTGILRRRIFALRSAAHDLQSRLPDLVERLRRGEAVDPDAELPEIRYGADELGMLGQALNQARRSSLETAMRQVEQYRGFERLLQRIARRTQLLIGMQMKRLSEMERRHEDPEVLEGLFDLDHLAARLRRYEENLVILGGGQPQRRWRKPVPLLDVLRSAQGEVQDYRRIRIETGDGSLLSERAVGPMVHVLAELMENAVSFSKPPTPVEVSATLVGRGLAIEIEDRGMGMDPEQYAEANALMASPPRMDVMARADDARLGLYVVARLAGNLGLKVELRPSSFGGTRVVVLVPAELISDGQQPPEQVPEASDSPPRPALAAPFPGRADDLSGPQPPPDHQDVFAARPLIGPWTRIPAVAPAPPMDPLPRRVRQASLVAELRETPPSYDEGPYTGPSDPQPLPRRSQPRRSGSTIGAFQRQSRTARLTSDSDHYSTHPSPGRD